MIRFAPAFAASSKPSALLFLVSNQNGDKPEDTPVRKHNVLIFMDSNDTTRFRANIEDCEVVFSELYQNVSSSLIGSNQSF